MMVQRDPKSVEMIYEFTQETALHYAAKYANRDVVALLLEMKASVNARDILGTFHWPIPLTCLGQTPLHKLAAYNAPYCVEAAKLLLHAGAKLEAEDVYQSTAITYALRNRNEDLLRVCHCCVSAVLLFRSYAQTINIKNRPQLHRHPQYKSPFFSQFRIPDK